MWSIFVEKPVNFEWEITQIKEELKNRSFENMNTKDLIAYIQYLDDKIKGEEKDYRNGTGETEIGNLFSDFSNTIEIEYP